MARVKRSTKARHRRKRVLDKAEGFFGRRKNCFTVAAVAVDKALYDAYIGRKIRKRDFRALWIQRINAAARLSGMSYSVFMAKLKKANIDLNRKVLADMAMSDPKGFEQLVRQVQNAA